MDAWHWATVAVLSVAFLGEVIGAYGKQRRFYQEEATRSLQAHATSNRLADYNPVYRPVDRWERLWYHANGLDRFPYLTVGFCLLVRGCTRLMVIALIVGRFAGGQNPLWSL